MRAKSLSKLLWTAVGALAAAAGALHALGVRSLDIPPGFLWIGLMFALVSLQPPALNTDAAPRTLFVRASLLPAVGAAALTCLLVWVLSPRAYEGVVGWLLPAALAAYVAAAWVRWDDSSADDARGA